MTTVLQPTYILGSTIKIRAVFKVDGALTDPTTVIFTAKPPSGDTDIFTYPTDSEIVRESLGIYYIEYQPQKVGTTYYRFEGTGDAKGVSEGCIVIEKSCVITSL